MLSDSHVCVVRLVGPPTKSTRLTARTVQLTFQPDNRRITVNPSGLWLVGHGCLAALLPHTVRRLLPRCDVVPRCEPYPHALG